MIHNSTCSVLLNLTSFASQTCQDSVNTGHEHLDKFNLINMNGRVYDPALARFLSPDPFIQAPGYSQSYNRYSYCLNNPLKYTDPSGYKTQRYDESGNPLYQTYVHWNGVDVSASPGSSNHWSDGFRSVYGNFMLMNPSTFQNFYGVSKNDYNEKIAPNYQSLSTTLTSFQRNSKGELGFYPANVKAERKSYHISVDKDGKVIITEFVEVTSKWVGFDASGQGGGVGQPGTWEGLIPIWGSGRAAVDHFQNGNYWRGIGYSALAISDVFLVKSIATAVGRGAWKVGAHSWSATRQWLGKTGYAEAGQPVHHWAISQATAKQYGIEAITNQPWNLMTFSNQSLHMRAGHGLNYLGQPGYGVMGQLWFGTPIWPKAVVGSYGGRLIGE